MILSSPQSQERWIDGSILFGVQLCGGGDEPVTHTHTHTASIQAAVVVVAHTEENARAATTQRKLRKENQKHHKDRLTAITSVT